jgi:hypothetical protein
MYFCLGNVPKCMAGPVVEAISALNYSVCSQQRTACKTGVSLVIGKLNVQSINQPFGGC